ncbi:MAG: roadblock/LC7 domain-containing protein [Candidatus Asgardarchaeia archaeon]
MPLTDKDIKEILSRLMRYEGVEGVVLSDEMGFPLGATIGSEQAETISALITSLLGKVQSIIEELKLSKLKVLTIKTEGHEILVTPEEGANLVVIRKTS